MKSDKICLECQSTIKGRSDKKFCDDNCRNNFNNRLNADQSKDIRFINAILKKNRRILNQLVQSETASISHQYLVQQGFNFSFFTHLYQNKKGNTYYFVYEYGYLPIPGEHYFIIKRSLVS